MKKERIGGKMIKKIVNNLAEKFTRKIYYKALMLEFLSEIKEIEKGKLKTLKAKDEIKKLLKRGDEK